MIDIEKMTWKQALMLLIVFALVIEAFEVGVMKLISIGDTGRSGKDRFVTSRP